MKKDMTVGREWKLIFLFTLPIMAGNVLQQLYNIVDGIVVGNFVGQDAFAGVGTCTPLVFLFLAFAMGLSVGAGVTVSQYFGAKRYDDLSIAIDTSLILIGCFGAVIAVAAYLVTPAILKSVLGAPANILPYGVTFFRIYCIGLFFQFIYNGIAFILRAVGDSKATLYFLCISAVLNAGLAVAFVILFHWGVAGTAIATVISQIVCASVSYIYMRRRFKFIRGGKHFDGKMCRLVLRLGIPSAIQQTIMAMGNTAMQRLVNSFGEASISAYSAAMRVSNFMFVPIFGFQSGLATFTGQNIGAGRFDRVKRGYHVTLIMAFATCIAITVVLYVFASPLCSLFDISGRALEMGVEQIRFIASMFFVFSYYAILGGVLQGSGDIMLQSVATLSALAVRVAVGYIGVHFGFLGYNAAWVTNPMGWVIAIVITTIRYLSGRWKTKAVVHRAPDDGEQTTICTDVIE